MKSMRLIAGIVVLVLVAAACSGSTQAPQAIPSAGAAAGTAKVDLSMWYFNFARHNAYQKDRIAAYTRAHPNVTINYDNSAPPTGDAGYEVKVNTALATNSAPDIFAVYISQAHRMITNKQLAPVDDATAKALGFGSVAGLKSSRLPGAFDPWSDDAGTPYGLHWELSWLSLYCNDDLLKAGGLDPTKVTFNTWDDVLRVGKQVISADPKFYKDPNGHFVHNFLKFPMYADDGWSMQVLTAFLAQSGGSVLAKGGASAAINSAEAVKGVQTMMTVSRELGDPNVGPQVPGDIFSAFAAGQQTCVTTSQTLYRSFLVPNNSPMLGKYHVYSLPSIDAGKPGNVFWGWAFVVNAQSKNKLAAWDFINFMLGDPQAASVAVSVWQPVVGVQDGWAIKQVPFSDALWASSRGGQAIFISDKYAEIAHGLRGKIETMAYQGSDVRKTLDDAAQAINGQLK